MAIRNDTIELTGYFGRIGPRDTAVECEEVNIRNNNTGKKLEGFLVAKQQSGGHPGVMPKSLNPKDIIGFSYLNAKDEKRPCPTRPGDNHACDEVRIHMANDHVADFHLHVSPNLQAEELRNRVMGGPLYDLTKRMLKGTKLEEAGRAATEAFSEVAVKAAREVRKNNPNILQEIE